MEDSTIPEPEDPPEECSMTKKEIWKKQISNYVKRAEMYNENKNKLYSVIWGQCSDTMKTKLKALKAYEEISEGSDSLKLLKEIKGISYRFETRNNLYSSMHDAKVAFYKNEQGKDETNSDYLSRFKIFWMETFVL